MIPAVLRQRAVAHPFVASMVARLPIGATGLVLILRTREMTGSYAAGGMVAGANALAFAIAAPAVGRLVDRVGQTRVLVPTALLFALALGAFAALPDGAPLGAAIACAVVAGAAFPPTGPTVRALWAERVADPHERHAMYATEATAVELIYISGPVLIVGALGAWSVQAAAAGCALFALAGTLAMAATEASRRWRASGGESRPRAGALAETGVVIILAATLLFGVSLGAIELATAAFAEAHGAKHWVGPLLGVWGLGSMLGGLVAARRPAPGDPVGRLAALYLLLALSTAPLVIAGGLGALAVALFAAGVFIAPSAAVANGILGEIAPPGTITEAFAWVGTAVGGGIAAGSALAGAVVEASGTDGGFLVAAAAVAAAALLLGAGVSRLRGARTAAV